MPEFLKALIAIFAIGTTVFYLTKPLFIAGGMSVPMFDVRRKCWYLVTAAAFLSLNFWIFVALLVGILVYTKNKEKSAISLYFFLMLVLPVLRAEVPGFGPVRFLVEIDYLRVLSVVLLLPICLQEWKRKASAVNRLALCDALLFAYTFLTILLHFQSDGPIGGLRYLIYTIADVGVPYYAITRKVNSTDDIKEILLSFASTGLVVSAIAIFEFARRWLLYGSLGDALGLEVFVDYLGRGDFLRALATGGQPIALGYDLIAVLGTVLLLKSEKINRLHYYSAVMLVVVGSIATLSKGPWVGMVLTAAVLILTDKKSAKKITYALFAVLSAAIFLTNTEFGASAIEYLPFVGKLDEGSMSYRQLLFDKSVQAIFDHPLFGSTDYLDQMEELRQGQGIIDLVNTYLVVALDSGLVGLALFVGYFLAMLGKVYASTKSYARGGDEEFLGRILIAIFIGLLFVLVSCSPILNIPAIYIGFSALALAYHRIAVKPKL